MTYSIYGRMSLDNCSLAGEWRLIKSRVPLDKVDEIIAHYKNTWRYVERREECLVGGSDVNSN
ncbi:hypothetical protein [Salmonella phage NINP13076]|nr:hypothetical protein [Salmonella phage NINP13076]